MKVHNLITQNLQTQSPFLDLGKCGLNGSEDALKKLSVCTHLKTLVLTDSWYDDVKDTWEASYHNGKPTQLRRIPAFLPKNLQHLYFEFTSASIGEKHLNMVISVGIGNSYPLSIFEHI